MEKTVILSAHNTTVEIAESAATLAILPVGATEQHGPHLPLATDTLIAEAVAQRAAEALGAYCLPVLPYSISHMHRGQTGVIWLRNRTLLDLLHDIASSLAREKFTHLAILNGHGGNFILIPAVQDLNLDFPTLTTSVLDLWEPIPASGLFPKLGSMMHADEFETACLLYLHPSMVRKELRRNVAEEVDREMLRYFPFAKIAAETHAGNPLSATEDQGRRAVALMVEHSVGRIRATLAKVARVRERPPS